MPNVIAIIYCTPLNQIFQYVTSSNFPNGLLLSEVKAVLLSATYSELLPKVEIVKRNIGVIYESLRDRNIRPAIFGPSKEGELDLVNDQPMDG
jgi:hypothetical protein